MAIATDTGSGGGLPFVKFMRPGDKLVAAFGGGHKRQQTKYGDSTQLLYKDDKKTPLYEEVMYLVAMPGTVGVVTGNLEKPETIAPIAPGLTVCFAVGGFKWGQVIDARKALPPYAGLAAGTAASGDVYEITMTAWSASTDNPTAATAAGFAVVNGRIVFTASEERKRWADARMDANLPTIVAKDYDVTVRRPRPDEAQWEQRGDALFSSKPWDRKDPALMMSGGPGPFDDAPAPGGIDRSQMF